MHNDQSGNARKLPLSRLPADDPKNDLSDDARRRISRALLESEQRQWDLLRAAEESGADIRQAVRAGNFEKARNVMLVTAREFVAAGKQGRELQSILDEQLEGAVNSLELSVAEKHSISIELLLVIHAEEPAPTVLEVMPMVRWGIRELREAVLMSQQELADAVKLHVGSVARHEGGHVRPHQGTVRRYAEFFSKKLGQDISPEAFQPAHAKR
jgi:DNA-binding XRE family transcriptional regulator